MYRIIPVLTLTLALVLAACGGKETPEKYMEEGIAHFDKKEYDQAIACYQKAIKLAPNSAVAYNLLGMGYRLRYFQLRDPELKNQEIAAFQKAVELDPTYWPALMNLGTTYYYMGDKTKAAPLFKQVLKLNPEHPEKAQIEKMIAEGEGKT